MRAPAADGPELAEWLAALGARENVVSVEAVATTRLRVQLANAALLDTARLGRLGALGVMHASATVAHIVVGKRATDLAARLQAVTGGELSPSAHKRAAPATAPGVPGYPTVALADRTDRSSS